LGFVFQPRFAPDFSLTVDYYKIPITGAIAQVSAQDIIDGCVDSYTSINNPLCALITRTPTGLNANKGITDVNVTYVNIGSLSTTGIDFTANYKWNLSEYGTVATSLTGTRLDTLTSNFSVGAAAIDSVRTSGAPKWRANLRTSWVLGDFTTSWTARYASETYLDNVTPTNFSPRGTARIVLHDVSLRWKSPFKAEFFVGANNLFNLQPKLGINNFSIPSGDTIGRFIYTGVSIKY
jgi:iron complex outermembrane recepter protein